MEYIRASSYSGTESTGSVQWDNELVNVIQQRCTNRHVIIVEDILDTGTTLASLLPRLENKARSVAVCTLLDKRLDDSMEKKVTAKYVGFSIPNHFIVGYGLDYNEVYRDVSSIFVLSQQGIDFDRRELYK